MQRYNVSRLMASIFDATKWEPDRIYEQPYRPMMMLMALSNHQKIAAEEQAEKTAENKEKSNDLGSWTAMTVKTGNYRR